MTYDQLEMKFLTGEEYHKQMLLRLGDVNIPAWMIRLYSRAFAIDDMFISEFYTLKREAMEEWDKFVEKHKDEEYKYKED